jgi:four helix bundle protein
MSDDLEKSKLWKQARALVQTVDVISKSIPAYEFYTITDQMHRTSVSLAGDVAMIAGKGDKGSIFEYRLARGRLLSIKGFIIISQDYGYVKDTSAVFVDIESMKREIDGKIAKLQEAEDESDEKNNAGDGDEV